tara:strand:+ start:339 stop:710 length:372 start_codon:yes stop_codon:yes gene_type:complete
MEYLYTLSVLVLLDIIYIYNTKNHYLKMIAKIQKNKAKVKKIAFVSIYFILAFLLNYFIIKVKKSKEDAFLLGSTVYGVYGLTNYAILDEWDTVLMFMDILWGGTLFYSTTYIIYRLNGIKKI